MHFFFNELELVHDVLYNCVHILLIVCKKKKKKMEKKIIYFLQRESTESIRPFSDSEHPIRSQVTYVTYVTVHRSDFVLDYQPDVFRLNHQPDDHQPDHQPDDHQPDVFRSGRTRQ